MSAYRHPAPAPIPGPRFERALPGFFTRVRLSDDRVRIDAPDVMAMLVLLHVLPLLVPVIAHWSWMLAALVCILAIFTTRIHLRISRGRVWFVRTIASVPWWVHRPLPSGECVQLDCDSDGDELSVVVAPRRIGEGRTVPVLTSACHNVHWLELSEILAACRRVLS
jgi:hypothetical protein